MDTKIKILNDLATVPTKGTVWSAGHDLYAAIPQGEITIAPHTTEIIDTGIAMEIPVTLFGAVFPRSGLATKQGLRLSNAVAVIDADYRGGIKIPMYNDSDVPRVIKQGDRIAQIVLIPYLNTTFTVVEELSNTDRGAGGFGSTGR